MGQSGTEFICYLSISAQHFNKTLHIPIYYLIKMQARVLKRYSKTEIYIEERPLMVLMMMFAAE